MGEDSTAENQRVKITFESDEPPVFLSPGDTCSITIHGEDVGIEWVDDG